MRACAVYSVGSVRWVCVQHSRCRRVHALPARPSRAVERKGSARSVRGARPPPRRRCVVVCAVVILENASRGRPWRTARPLLPFRGYEDLNCLPATATFLTPLFLSSTSVSRALVVCSCYCPVVIVFIGSEPVLPPLLLLLPPPPLFSPFTTRGEPLSGLRVVAQETCRPASLPPDLRSLAPQHHCRLCRRDQQ